MLKTPTLAVVLLLMSEVSIVDAGGIRHLRHHRRHASETERSPCPDRCSCRPVGEVPCDWCAENDAADTHDDRVSCEGCGYGKPEQVFSLILKFYAWDDSYVSLSTIAAMLEVYLLQQCDVVNFAYADSLLCVELDASRNAQSANNLRIRIITFPYFNSFLLLSTLS